MRKLKKWSCLLLALLMLPALAACGKKQQPDSDASQNEVQDTDTPQDSTPPRSRPRCWWCIFRHRQHQGCGGIHRRDTGSRYL